VISVVLYGRNDAHGYNLHRRAALSLNCLAEVLTDPDDELLFVDYNTPDELPTFVEALADTLTDRCIDRLRVVRVPAAVHRERYAARTHLPALEPVARNVGVRRSNAANRWVLSTNTDMIFVPATTSLSEACRDLPDGFYGLPRYELPEWVWEQLPRTDPTRALSELRRLGPRISLDEPTVSDEWVRFDAPGDFQLCLREDIVAIDAFDEEMLLGWHVDSNFGRRMVIHRGSVETFEERAAGYHCNHSRIPTVYHGPATVANDLERFYVSLQTAELPEQRAGWGLADLKLDEVPLRHGIAVQLADALAEVMPASTGARSPSRAYDSAFGLTYDSAHVLAYIADSIAVSPRGTTIGYLGANAVLLKMLRRLTSELEDLRLEIATDEESVGSLAEADVLLVDLGLDVSAWEEPDVRQPEEPPRYPEELRSVLFGLERLVELERTLLARGEHPRRFVLVNSATSFTDAFVLAHLDCSHTSIHSRVRRATVKLSPASEFELVDKREMMETDIAVGSGITTTRAALAAADRLHSWNERVERPRESLRVPNGLVVDLAGISEFAAFGDDWCFPEPGGMWTAGPRIDLRLAIDGYRSGSHLLCLRITRVGAGRDASLALRMAIDDVRVAEGRLAGGPRHATLRASIPDDALERGWFDLRLELEPPASWDDDPRQLGVCVRSIALQRDDMRRVLADVGQRIRRRLRMHLVVPLRGALHRSPGSRTTRAGARRWASSRSSRAD